MRINRRFDYGWLYLICGLVLTVSAIILPADMDLQSLSTKKSKITSDLAELDYRVSVYEDFLRDVQRADPQLMQRLIEMQFNRTPEGTPVVIDTSAPETPLAWVAQRAKKVKALPMESGHASILSTFVDGQGRLWLLACGVFTIFIGLVASPTSLSDT